MGLFLYYINSGISFVTPKPEHGLGFWLTTPAIRRYDEWWKDEGSGRNQCFKQWQVTFAQLSPQQGHLLKF